MIDITINNQKTTIKTLEPQTYKNLTIVPIVTPSNLNVDFLTLTKGLELGLIEITELNEATVGTILVKNNAVTPLILIDGEEIIGAKQNRIISGTVIVPARTSQEVSVCCVEQGRWKFDGGKFFSEGKTMANINTRQKRAFCYISNKSAQSVVWDSIEELESVSPIEFNSKSSALYDNYKSNEYNIEKYLLNFERKDGQTGIIAILNGEVLACEFYYNDNIYGSYHEKLLKSFIIEAITCDEDINYVFSQDDVINFIDRINNSKVVKEDSKGFAMEGEMLQGLIKVVDDTFVHAEFFINRMN